MEMASALLNVFIAYKSICTLPPTFAMQNDVFPNLNELKPNDAQLLEKKGWTI